MKIPFNRPYLTGKEFENIRAAHALGQLAGDGEFTARCQEWIADACGSELSLLTHSCTAALEMAAILVGIEPGDEVIMPSFTFVSTANAFALRGAKPIFVDIRNDTLNINEDLIERSITKNTKAIVVVHYAGVACEMDAVMSIARRNGLVVVEDAAQAILARYKGRPLGGIGDLGCFSFHETKNVISGEGGALVVSNKSFSRRAEIIREKGTNRSQFFRGEVDKYTWQDIGSSYLPGEMTAAFLEAQLDSARAITDERLKIWEKYQQGLSTLEERGICRLPKIPSHCDHNGHIFHLIMNSPECRQEFIDEMRDVGVHCVFH